MLIPNPTFAVVFVAALLTVAATGIGALALLAAPQADERRLGLANAAAAGLMLAVCHTLLVAGCGLNPLRTLAGVGLGVIAVVVAGQLLRQQDRPATARVRGEDARRVALVIGILTLYSAAEGLGLGAAFGAEPALGVYVTTAIALHNAVEGLAVAMAMAPRGQSVQRAARWCVVSSLPQPLLAVPACVVVTTSPTVLPFALGIAAGAMIWMAFAEMIPQAHQRVSPVVAGIAVTVAFGAMLGLQLVFAV